MVRSVDAADLSLAVRSYHFIAFNNEIIDNARAWCRAELRARFHPPCRGMIRGTGSTRRGRDTE